MTPERWQRLKGLFEQALELAPEDRAGFAEAACGGDAELLRELLALLASDGEAGSFLVGAAGTGTPDDAAPEGRASALAAGAVLEGKYRIEGLVGRGGMGEVYRALDTRIGREVAVKVLPVSLSADAARLRRFEKEARAAGALNHPNVLALYDIGTHGGAPYLVSELLRGRSLRQAMAMERLGLGAAVGYAAQVAQGLAAAHELGVVHRDVKPDNLFLRTDGYVKVLDFGLAKLAQEGQPVDSRATTKQLADTQPGAIMGTPAYMSPEQARGEEVDAGTDVWSLGVVLYEMAAGRLPFEGRTSSDMIAAILTREPAPLRDWAEGVPAELEAIVGRALAKQRDARYATAAEMAADLKRLERRMEAVGEAEGSAGREPREGGARGTGGGAKATPEAGTLTVADGAATPAAGAAAATAEEARATSSAEYLVGAVGRHKWAAVGALGALLLAAGGIGYQTVRNTADRPPPPPAAPFHSAEFTKLITTGEPGRTVAAAISPDGKLIAHAVSGDAGQSLWTRQVATQSALQIVPSTAGAFTGVTFSPNGEYVYYVFKTAMEQPTIYKAPALGGAPTKILEWVDSAVAISPDGKRFAFVRENPDSGTSHLLVANADGSGERVLSERKYPQRWFTTPAAPAWSPDGTRVACGLGDFSSKDDPCSIVELPVDGGEERRITAPRPDWWIIGRLAWVPNGGGLVASIAQAAVSGPRWQILSISYPSGEIKRVTNDTHHYLWPSLTIDGGKLLVVEQTYRSAIWGYERADPRRGRQLTFGETDGLTGLASAPDGRLVFADVANSIWVAGADGSNPRLLTGDDHTNYHPCVTPDGSSIVFASVRGGSWAVWRMNVDGGNVRQLTSGPDDDVPQCTPDGWVLFSSTTRSGSPALYKVPLEGGEVVPVSEEPIVRAAPSPDGRSLACLVQRPNGAASIAVMSSQGGALRTLIDLAGATLIRWRRDGRAVTFSAGGGTVLEVPVGGGPAKLVMKIDEGSIYSFDWTPDGTRLIAARGEIETNLVLISGFE